MKKPRDKAKPFGPLNRSYIFLEKISKFTKKFLNNSKQKLLLSKTDWNSAQKNYQK